MVTAQMTLAGGSQAEALFQEALDHHLGRGGVPYNPMAAKELYIKALGKGSAKAALNLGWLLRNKKVHNKRAEDLRHMVGYFVQAAKLGSADALYCLHEACSLGLGVPKDSGKARQFLHKAAQDGSPLAMTKLGLNCIGNDKVKEGRKWLLKALELGCGEAGYHLASLSYAVERDTDAMMRYLKEGADKGSEKCIRRLALIYELGQFGQEADQEKAEHYFQLLPKRRASTPFGFSLLSGYLLSKSKRPHAAARRV